MSIAAAPALTDSMDDVARAERLRVRVIAPFALIGGGVAGVLAAYLVSINHPAVIPALALLLLPVVVWRWPHASVVVLVAAATTIECFPYIVGNRNSGALTDRIPLYRGLSYLRFAGLSVTPLECILMVMVVVVVLRSALDGTLRLPGSFLGKSMAALLFLVFIGFFIGISHHGNFHYALVEIRPWLYLSISFVVSSAVLTTRSARRAMLWALVLGSAFKAIQGAFIFSYARHLKPRPEAILGHEEAFFFGLFIALTLGLWVFQQRSRLRVVATLLLPVVLLVDMANSRRTAWAIIGFDLIVVMVIAYVSLPDRRQMLRRLSAVLAVFSVFYFPAFWNKDGTFAQPARAARSIIAPTARDQQSNQYRNQENVNLIYTIRGGGPLGVGFGVPIAYTGIVDISNQDSFIGYVTHDGVLYMWMRLGMQGEIALWTFLGAGIMAACRAARAKDREVAFFGTFVMCAMTAYIVQGYYDFGFDWFRIALTMGCLLGAVEASIRTVATKASATPTPALTP